VCWLQRSTKVRLLPLAFRVAVGALILGGCGILDRSFQTMIPRHSEEPSTMLLPLVVHDRTGLVLGIVSTSKSGQTPLSDVGVTPVDGDPSTLLVYWIGGSCDRAIDMTLVGDTSYKLTIATHMGDGACDANGYGRALLLHMQRPIAAEMFDVYSTFPDAR